MITPYYIEFTPTFAKHFRKLSVAIRKKAEKQEAQLRADPFSPRLKTHKLAGTLSGYWACSIDYQYRLIFRLVKSHHIVLVDVGTHAVYQ